MSDTELKVLFMTEECSANSPESPPEEHGPDEKSKMKKFSRESSQTSLRTSHSAASSEEWSLASDPSDIFQKVISENEKGSRRWSSAYDVSPIQRSYDTGQIMSVLNQLLVITKGHSVQLQQLASLTLETRDAQQLLLSKVAEGNEEIHDRIEKLELALEEDCNDQIETIRALDTLNELEKKLETPLALQRKLDFIEGHVETMAKEIYTLGISFEEMKKSLSDKADVQQQHTEKYVDEASEKFTSGLVTEDMLESLLKVLADQKDMLKSTARNFEELKTYCQHDYMPEKLTEMLEDVKKTLGTQIIEVVTSSTKHPETLTLTQAAAHVAPIHLSELLDSGDSDENGFDILDNKSLFSSALGRRRSCF